jgi:hypothetical protein
LSVGGVADCITQAFQIRQEDFHHPAASAEDFAWKAKSSRAAVSCGRLG